MRVCDIRRTMIFLGSDLVICVGNESGAHIGSCVISETYEKNGKVHVTSSVRNRVEHKDGEVALLYAETAAKLLNRTVCCVCGIHYDDITPEEIREVIAWCKQDAEAMKQELI